MDVGCDETTDNGASSTMQSASKRPRASGSEVELLDSPLSPAPLSPTPSRRSIWWDYVETIDGKIVCIECKRVLNVSDISNVGKHFQAAHTVQHVEALRKAADESTSKLAKKAGKQLPITNCKLDRH